MKDEALEMAGHKKGSFVDPNDIVPFLGTTAASQNSLPDKLFRGLYNFYQKVQIGNEQKEDYVQFQRVLKRLQRSTASFASILVQNDSFIKTLAATYDSLLAKDYSKVEVSSSILELLFLIEDISEHAEGKIFCGKFFVPRLLILSTTKLPSVRLQRAAIETLCALITKSPNNQEAVLANVVECYKLFKVLLPKCGDFHLQASISEILHRLSKRNPELLDSVKDNRAKETILSLQKMKKPNIITEIRSFVHLVNESMGKLRTVYSFVALQIIVNDCIASLEEDKWVHFGLNHVSFYAASEILFTHQEYEADKSAHIVDLEYRDIVNYTCCSPTCLEFSIQSPAYYQYQDTGQEAGQIFKIVKLQFFFSSEDLLAILSNILPKLPQQIRKTPKVVQEIEVAKSCSQLSQHSETAGGYRKSSIGIMPILPRLQMPPTESDPKANRTHGTSHPDSNNNELPENIAGKKVTRNDYKAEQDCRNSKSDSGVVQQKGNLMNTSENLTAKLQDDMTKNDCNDSNHGNRKSHDLCLGDGKSSDFKAGFRKDGLTQDLPADQEEAQGLQETIQEITPAELSKLPENDLGSSKDRVDQTSDGPSSEIEDINQNKVLNSKLDTEFQDQTFCGTMLQKGRQSTDPIETDSEQQATVTANKRKRHMLSKLNDDGKHNVLSGVTQPVASICRQSRGKEKKQGRKATRNVVKNRKERTPEEQTQVAGQGVIGRTLQSLHLFLNKDGKAKETGINSFQKSFLKSWPSKNLYHSIELQAIEKSPAFSTDKENGNGETVLTEKCKVEALYEFPKDGKGVHRGLFPRIKTEILQSAEEFEEERGLYEDKVEAVSPSIWIEQKYLESSIRKRRQTTEASGAKCPTIAPASGTPGTQRVSRVQRRRLSTKVCIESRGMQGVMDISPNLMSVKEEVLFAKSKEAISTDADTYSDGTKVITLFADLLVKFKQKVKSRTRDKIVQAINNAAEKINKGIKDTESQIQSDVDEYKQHCNQKFAHLEVQLQDQKKKLKEIWERFENELKAHYQTWEQIKLQAENAENELKLLADKQKTSHKRLISQTQQKNQQLLADTEKTVSSIREAAGQMYGLKRLLMDMVNES